MHYLLLEKKQPFCAFVSAQKLPVNRFTVRKWQQYFIYVMSDLSWNILRLFCSQRLIYQKILSHTRHMNTVLSEPEQSLFKMLRSKCSGNTRLFMPGNNMSIVQRICN